MYKTIFESDVDALNAAVEKLDSMTPKPVSSMLEKQPREEAIAKRAARASMVIENVAPTAEVPGKILIFALTTLAIPNCERTSNIIFFTFQHNRFKKRQHLMELLRQESASSANSL